MEEKIIRDETIDGQYIFISDKRIISDNKTYKLNNIDSVDIDIFTTKPLLFSSLFIGGLFVFLADIYSPYFLIGTIFASIAFIVTLIEGKKNYTYSTIISFQDNKEVIFGNKDLDGYTGEMIAKGITSDISDALALK